MELFYSEVKGYSLSHDQVALDIQQILTKRAQSRRVEDELTLEPSVT